MKISVGTDIAASLIDTWNAWVTPADIRQWNFATEDWCCPQAEVDLRVGGTFKYRMDAKDGSMGFDFEGVYTQVVPHESIHFSLGDDRIVTVEFKETLTGTEVIETFEAEDEHSAELQKQGWQNILNNFKAYVESRTL